MRSFKALKRQSNVFSLSIFKFMFSFLGDGSLTESELYNVLDEGCREDKMGFDEDQIENLTQIVWQEAVGNKAVMTLQEFQVVLYKHPNLVKGLCNRYIK